MSSVAPPPSGRTIHGITTVGNGRFALTEQLAIGGMGEVWTASDTVLHREVAVKILRDELVDSPAFLERFRAEARHTAALAHPGIARLFDYGEEEHDGRCVAYLVMELVPGRPLSELMAEHGVLPIATVLSIMAQTAEALQAAHALGVIHRDIKPSNLLVLDDGTIKVTDFGIARAANSMSITEAGQIIGTARYISPEQASGTDVTPASDIYSLGVVGYEMLAGHPPFTAENTVALAMAHVGEAPPPLPTTVPAGVRDAIADALAKDPAERPQDARAFASRLRGLADEILASQIGDPTRVADSEAVAAFTTVMDHGDGSRTAIMPIDHVRAMPPSLGVHAGAHSGRRQRRWIGVAFITAVLFIIALVQIAADGPAVKPNIVTTTVPAPAVDPNASSTSAATTVTTIAPPTSTTTIVVPGKDNGKDKEKGNKKPGG